MEIITRSSSGIEAPGSPATLVELLRTKADERRQKPLYTFLNDGESDETTLSYGEFEVRARAIGGRLQSLRAEGARVLLLFPPGLDYIAGFFGCLYAGAVAVPAYPPRLNQKLDRLQSIIADAQVTLILTTETVRAKAQPLFSEAPELKEVKWLTVDETDPEFASYWREPNIDEESIAFLQYTSGSTSTPKGVMVTHANLLHNEGMIKEAFGQSEDSIIVGWLPLYHDMGLIGNVLQPLYLGARCILMSPVAFLQRPLRWLDAISRYRATTSGAPNFAYELCARRINAEQRATLDLSSWSVAYNGAEPVRAATQEKFAETFASCGFRPEAFQPCYGLAEATLLVSGKRVSERPLVKSFQARALEQNLLREADAEERNSRVLVGNGAALAEQKIIIVNPESLNRCAPDEVGEVWVSGPSVARGYWNRPEETAQTFGAYLAATGEGPFLRTGDLGFINEGELFITGRLKDLVIIRGLNHYPQDIELTAEQSHPMLRPGCGAAFSVEVEGEEQLVIVQEVEPRKKPDTEEVFAAIREAVSEQHEAQVYALALIDAGTIPKTSSGKIQRRACRAKFLAGELSVIGEWRGAKGETEREATRVDEAVGFENTEDVAAWLASLLASKLGIEAASIDVRQSFNRYGLDSLAAIELAHSVEARLGVDVSVISFLESSSIAQLASEIARQLCDIDAQPLAKIKSDEREATADQSLSYGQRALWFLHQLEPASAAYNIASAVRILSPLDVRALRASLQTLVDRHASLRTTFEARQGEPVRRVHELMEVSFQAEDAAQWSEAELSGRLVEEANRPFDLEQGPLLRVSLFRRSEQESVLLLAMHHIITDFWSLVVLAEELGVLYRAATQQTQPVLPPAGQPYSEYARGQLQILEGAEGERLWNFWKERLSGELPALNLPTDRQRPSTQTFRGASLPFKLDAALTARLRELGRANDATLYVTLLAAFELLLHRYTGQQRFTVGSPTAGRNSADWSSTVGYFVNPVVLRADLEGNPPFQTFLRRVRQEALSAFAHQDYPFPLLVKRLQPERELSRSPLFQVMFILQKPHLLSDEGLASFVLGESGARLELGGLSLESIALEQRVAQFELTLTMAQVGDELAASFVYNADLFDASTIKRFIRHFEQLLSGIAASPESRISELPLLTAEEQHQLLVEWNDTGRPYSTECMHQLFEAQVERTPAEVALVTPEERLTYSELNARANRLAHHLRSLGVAAESLVGVLSERNADMVVALLAVLKAGGAYVPLDPLYPQERVRFMLEDAGVKVLLTQEHLSRNLPPHNAHVLRLDTEREAFAHYPETNPAARVIPENLAYVIYTSGSTGRPKGVAIQHTSASVLIHWAHETFSHQHFSGTLASTSICFDLSIFELFVPLSIGGTVILSQNALQLPLLEAASAVTLVNTVPSAMNELVRSRDLPSSVRVVNLAGEPLPNSLAQQIYQESAVAEVWNLYGPSEDTTYSTGALVVRGARGVTPIGRPLANTQAYVLDAQGGLVPAGVAGELYLGGDGLARCYLERAELTAEKFVPDAYSGRKGARLYRTGDLVRRKADGELEYLGRIDHQVKVRGFRIELGEIEAALREQAGVRDAVVMVREDVRGDQRIVAYLVSEVSEADGAGEARRLGEIKERLSQRLPHYMMPQAYVWLEELPLTPNGKIDRKRLPAPASERADEEFAAPRNQIEEILSGIWESVLGAERVGIHDNFFDLGGHSLLATQITSRIQEAFQVKLPLRRLFETPTVAGLAAHVADALKEKSDTPAPPIKRVSRRAALPLSFAQQRLWFLQQWEQASAAYNVPAAVRLLGRLDVAALERSIEAILNRHEALRTTFKDVDGQPVQVVGLQREWSMPKVDLSALPESAREAEAMRLAAEEAQRLFNLSEGPLLRASLLRLSDEEHVLLLTMHHIVSDGWSIGILIRELTAFYEGFSTGQSPTLPTLPIQYADFAYWQRQWLTSEALKEQLAYWRRQLADSAPVLELPTDRPHPAAQTFHGATESFHLSPGLSDSLRALSRRQGTTLFMTLLAAFQTLLSRYTHQEDILVGTPVAGRTRLEIEDLIGFFVNTLVLRTDLSGNPTFAELLNRVREVSLEAYLNQDVPFELLVQQVQPERSLSHSPLFQVMFIMQNTPRLELALPGLNVRTLEVESEIAKFDLTLAVKEVGDELVGSFEYNTDLFDASTIKRFIRHFEQLLSGIADNPESRISELPLLTAEEQHQLLVEWNDTGRPYSTECMHQLFEAQVERTPAEVALVTPEERLTYSELNARANRLAWHLRSLGIRPEKRVGILLERSAQMVAALLAVLKAGGCYVPLDPAYPQERLSFMMRDAEASVLITEEKLAGLLEHDVEHVLFIDKDSSALEQYSTGNLSDVRVDTHNLAYLIYTSGSTGRPKGVAIQHTSACVLIHWAHETFSPEHFSGTLASTSICFDLSIFELFVPLSIGGTVILSQNALQLPLLEAASAVTLVNTVPSAMNELVRSRDLPASVRVVNLAGEPLPNSLAQQIYQESAVAEVWNLYGPSEDTTYSTGALIVRGAANAPPIGRPVANTQAYVLDREGGLVPVGVSGELYLGGDGLARCYLERAELTAEKFVPDVFSGRAGARLYRTGDLVRYRGGGTLEYLGRIDHQVKVRGFRIELGEIEAALREQAGVRDSVVLVREELGGEKKIVAYVVSEEGEEGGGSRVAELREGLSRRLPQYMMPQAYVWLAELPLTPNGKIDRKRLPAPEVERSEQVKGEYVEPRTEVERIIARIWSEVLGVERVGIHDNFFDLGGHSLLATQALSHIKRALQVEVSLRTLFETPTIAALAAMIEENAARAKPAAGGDAPALSMMSRKERKMSLLRSKLKQLPEHEAKRLLEERKHALNSERNNA
ncbi:MAG TPA: amino acid adenylation domain-containing protein [Pyrinomonadaceae bacterium]|jgi:amino acid adenylation domain-containing protein